MDSLGQVHLTPLRSCIGSSTPKATTDKEKTFHDGHLWASLGDLSSDLNTKGMLIPMIRSYIRKIDNPNAGLTCFLGYQVLQTQCPLLTSPGTILPPTRNIPFLMT